MHGEFLIIEKSDNNVADNSIRMSKSSGNFLTLDSLIENGFDPLEYRYFLLTSHYRSKLKFSFESLKASSVAFKKLKNFVIHLRPLVHVDDEIKSDQHLSVEALGHLNHFEKNLAQDLNMPEVISTLWGVVNDKILKEREKLYLLYRIDQVLGFSIKDFQEEVLEVPKHLDILLKERDKARANKEWAKSDLIRDQILVQGYIIVDEKGTSKLKKK
jgi:cysteinyl-tRNA synthetase